jgi:hypothetical protein
MRRVVVLAAVIAACAVAVSPAGATNECKGLQVCVPIAGPWVVATPVQVEYQLSCPKNYIVAGLDAELSARGIDIGFAGSLGSPVNPGITTARDVVFLGRLLRTAPGATFRPHIGCVPASGGGRRVPTAYHAYPPGKLTARRVVQIPVHAGTTRVAAGCGAGQRLVSATHAIAFIGNTPPSANLVASVTATHTVHRSSVTVTAHATRAGAIVQLDLLCAPK